MATRSKDETSIELIIKKNNNKKFKKITKKLRYAYVYQELGIIHIVQIIVLINIYLYEFSSRHV